MDSFEVNKILGAILGTLTFTLALSIGADMLFSAHAPEKPGYELPSPAEDAGHGAGAPAAAQAEPIAVRLAKADPAKGEKLTAACHSCHTFEKGGPNKVGPNLYGVVGNHHAHLDSFSYSAPMKEKSGEQWTFEALDHFLENPKAAIPGTAMSFIGIKKPDQRADVIAWLNQNSDKPLPLPTPAAAAEGAAPAGGAPADGAAPAGGAPAPGAGDAGTTGPTGVPQPESGKANVPPTPPSGAPQGGTPEDPQGGAGNKAPVQAPTTQQRQPAH